jgi:hypothetical protein
MIKNLFTKHEHRVFPGLTKEQAVQGASWFWRSRQFGINFQSPYALAGAQYYSRMGLRQQVHITCFEMGQGAGVDVSFSGELTDEGAMVGAVGAILVLPVAVAVGAVSYIEYENDANRLLSDFWTYMSSYSSERKPPAEGGSAPSWAEGGGPPKARACSSCGAPADPDSRFCKHCGTAL